METYGILPMIRCENVHKRFGRLEVLRGVTFDVARGEVVVVAGPSGSGKSTLLRCINHLEKVNQGRIYVDGHPVGYREVKGKFVERRERDVARMRASIGMVFQRFNLFPHLTALGNVIDAPIHVRKMGRREAQEAGRAMLAKVGLGDKIDADAPHVNITEPVGSIKDPGSKISPFKFMEGTMAVDLEHRHLMVPHLFPKNKEDTTAYWKHTDWQKAYTTGMQAAHLPYSGKYKWINTRMYWGIEHEVMPADMALSCVQCHESLKGERTCNRCHQDNKDVDFKKISQKGTDFSFMASKGRDVSHLIGTTDYINFKALGYKGDPIIHGGRFKKLPMGYKPQ